VLKSSERARNALRRKRYYLHETQRLSKNFVRTSATTALASRGFAKEPKQIDAEVVSPVASLQRSIDEQGGVCRARSWTGGALCTWVSVEQLPMARRAGEAAQGSQVIAPDVMGMGYTQTPKEQKITPQTQVEMLGMFLDSLHIDTVDLVANDSGGMVAQLFIAKYPQRVANAVVDQLDVDKNNPPPQFLPFVRTG